MRAGAVTRKHRRELAAEATRILRTADRGEESAAAARGRAAGEGKTPSPPAGLAGPFAARGFGLGNAAEAPEPMIAIASGTKLSMH
jgi:hypothetical protein